MNDGDDFNGRGPRDSEPSLPPLSQAAIQGVLERTINRQSADERDIARIDRRTRELAAGTSAWQREVNVRLERIEGCVERLTNQMKLMTFHVQAIQYMKIAWPSVLAVFAGGFVAALTWFVAHR